MTMTRDQIAELKRLAEKATPGPWAKSKNSREVGPISREDDQSYGMVMTVAWIDSEAKESDAAFMKAAANPQTILSLLALAERALEPQGQALPVHMVCYQNLHGPSEAGKWREVSKEVYETFAPENRRILYVVPEVKQHSDDIAVDRFAAAMKQKLALAREKGRGGWENCPQAMLSRMLREHVNKGDPRDVANFCMMLWNNGAGIAEVPPWVSPAVAQPVADEREEYERMLRTGYQHDNVRRQERGLASSDELTQEQEREIAERVALKFPSDAGLRKDSPVAFSCARRVAHPTSWTMTCDKHCGDDSKCLRAASLETSARAALCQPAEEGGKS